MHTWIRKHLSGEDFISKTDTVGPGVKKKKQQVKACLKDRTLL